MMITQSQILQSNPYIWAGINKKPLIRPLYDMILTFVAKGFEIDEQDLFKKTRYRHITLARQTAQYLAQKYCHGYGCNKLGELFSQHHSTVIHGFNTVGNLLQTDDKLKHTVSNIEKEIKKYY